MVAASGIDFLPSLPNPDQLSLLPGVILLPIRRAADLLGAGPTGRLLRTTTTTLEGSGVPLPLASSTPCLCSLRRCCVLALLIEVYVQAEANTSLVSLLR